MCMAELNKPLYVHVIHHWRNGSIVGIKEEGDLRRLGDENWEKLFRFGGPLVTLRGDSCSSEIRYRVKSDECMTDQDGHAVRAIVYELVE